MTLGGEVLTLSGEPLEKAEVSVTCPEVCVSAVTDRAGRFFTPGDVKCAIGCRVTVRRDGYQSFTADVARHCIPPGGGGGVCRKVWLETRVAPVAGK